MITTSPDPEEIGSTFVSICTVDSVLPVTSVSWYRAYTDELLTADSTHMFDSEAATMTVSDVGTLDEGGYYCKAINDAGESDNSNIITLIVFGKHSL